MTQPSERLNRLTRRDLLKAAAIAAGEILFAPVFSACGPQEKTPTPTQTLLGKEKESGPSEGDIVFWKDHLYLFRNEKRYPVLPENIEAYKRNTKFEKYGRKVVSVSDKNFEQYPLGEVPTESFIIDLFTGDLKVNKFLGGEMNVYFAGFMTDGGIPYDPIKPKDDAFIDIRKALLVKHFGEEDSLFFTYGEKGIAVYKSKNTTRDPKENIKNALDFFLVLKEEFPLVQFNLVAHSLGGMFALAAAMKHYDAINNLILVNSPIRGIQKTTQRSIAVSLLRTYARDEKVTQFLFDMWDNRDYQKQLEKFVSFFVGIGRNLTLVIDEGDPIVPVESSSVKGAKEVRLLKVGNNVEVAIEDLLFAHGRPLRDKGIANFITEEIGEDLAEGA